MFNENVLLMKNYIFTTPYISHYKINRHECYSFSKTVHMHKGILKLRHRSAGCVVLNYTYTQQTVVPVDLNITSNVYNL